MRVELDIYSGRPNPTWHLEPAEIEELRLRLSERRPARDPAAMEGLGYRGFRIVNEGLVAELPLELRVFRQHVTVRDSDGTEARYSVDGLEAWLADMAGNRGYGDLVAKLQ